MSPGPVFVALVNPKSGGNVGSTLLARFRDILDGGRVYNLAEEGPKRALEEHWGKPNLRIIGRTQKLALDRKARPVDLYLTTVGVHLCVVTLSTLASFLNVSRLTGPKSDPDDAFISL